LFNFFKKATPDDTQLVVEWVLTRARQTFPDYFESTSEDERARILRFEAISVHMALALWYLKKRGADYAKLSQRVHDELFDRFDVSLREQGVSDVKVGREIKKFAAAFRGRLKSYDEAFDAMDVRLMGEGLSRNLVCSDTVAMGKAINYIAEAKRLSEMDKENWLETLGDHSYWENLSTDNEIKGEFIHEGQQ